MSYKNGIFAKEIITLQNNEGIWGDFHSMAIPRVKVPLTTEQALRRLKILGFTIEDDVIQKAIEYLRDCLIGKKKMPDGGSLNKTYADIMYATWIRQFTDDDEYANKVADDWVSVISRACINNAFDETMYQTAYDEQFGKIERASLSLAFNKFYTVAIVANRMKPEDEIIYFDKILSYPMGIYYFSYDKILNIPPQAFASKEASKYLGAVEVLSMYKNKQCKYKLAFITNWLNNHKDSDGYWDMGSSVKDGLYFPLSDSWKKSDDRKKDCTYRINKIINALK